MFEKEKAELRFYSDKVFELLEDLVEKMARQILKDNDWLDYFCMAMGVATFTAKNGKDYDLTDFKEFRELDNLIDKYNHLGILGCPMMFTADGPNITKW